MGLMDKFKDKATQFKGKTKQRVGEETGDPELAEEGARDELKGKATEAVHNVRDKAKDMADDVKRAMRKE